MATRPQPSFSVGDLVQVNDDVMNLGWDDLPIGGWVGEVTKVLRRGEKSKYNVRWTEKTLAKCHYVYKALAELEDLLMEEYEGLAESDLHAFAGGDVVLAEPDDAVISQYADRPLDPEDHFDRIRMIFGTKPLEWFPMLGDNKEEDDQLLRRYYDYLLEHVVFPFDATYIRRSMTEKPFKCAIKVQKLIDPDEVAKAEHLDSEEGIYCSGFDPDGKLLEVPLRLTLYNDGFKPTVEMPRQSELNPQRQLLDDYNSWIGGATEQSEIFAELLYSFGEKWDKELQNQAQKQLGMDGDYKDNVDSAIAALFDSRQ